MRSAEEESPYMGITWANVWPFSARRGICVNRLARETSDSGDLRLLELSVSSVTMGLTIPEWENL